MITIKNVKPFIKNAKKHPKEQLVQLANIVKEVGWRQPVVVNQEGIIVAGHGRFATWEKYQKTHNLKPIWVIDDMGNTVHGGPETTPLTVEQEGMWRLADNRVAESDWDMGLVADALKDLSVPMLDLTGFDKDLVLGDDVDMSIDLQTEGDGLEQITFTLTNLQATAVRDAIKAVKDTEDYEAVVATGQNKNSNGNALYTLINIWEQNQ